MSDDVRRSTFDTNLEASHRASSWPRGLSSNVERRTSNVLPFMQILFFGTPEFAVPSLRALLGEGFDVVGVVTRPDRPQGRSRSTLVPFPVKAAAIAEGLTVFEPERPRGAEFLDTVRVLGVDLAVVVAYGHSSFRPDRPTAPGHTQRACVAPTAAAGSGANSGGDSRRAHGDRSVDHADRAGARCGARIAANQHANRARRDVRGAPAPTVRVGAQALVEALALVELNAATELPQDEAAATYAPKIEKDAARIDWTRPAEIIARAVRAYDPRPGATTFGPGGEVKLFGAQIVTERTLHEKAAVAEPGTVCVIDDAGCGVACGAGVVRIAQVQPAGRSRMAAIEWSRGRGIKRRRPIPLVNSPPVVHAVTTDDIVTREDIIPLAAGVMRALGPRGAVHLRANGASGRRLFDLATELARYQQETGAWLVINDRVDVALCAGARAVQLTTRSLTLSEARQAIRVAHPQSVPIVIGASVHSVEEARAAAEEAEDGIPAWLVAGHVFPTASHPGAPERGTSFLADILRGRVDPRHRDRRGAADTCARCLVGGRTRRRGHSGDLACSRCRTCRRRLSFSL